MDEERKYSEIKRLGDEGGNKDRVALNLGIKISTSAVTSILESEYILSPRVTKAKRKRVKAELKRKEEQAQTSAKADRLKRTLSRLPVKLRLAGVTTIEQANEFLTSYVKEFNEKFAHELHSIPPMSHP